MKTRLFAACLAMTGLSLAGCAYEARPVAAPAHNVVLSFGEPIKGRWLLYVDASSLKQVVRPSDMQCAAHSFPLDLSDGFTGSINQTLKNILAEVELVQEQPSMITAKARGARGIIIVRGEAVSANLRVVPGFMTANISTEVRVTASVAVDGQGGRLLGTTTEGDGKSDTGAGAFCSNGPESLNKSSADALRSSVRKIGEAIGNSERVRKS